jgi:hypothetical protein
VGVRVGQNHRVVEAVRYVGVVVAVLGAFITAPSGTGLLVDDFAKGRRAVWQFVLRHIPWHHRPATLNLSGHAVGSTSVVGNATVMAEGWAWMPGAPPAEQIERLRQRSEILSDRINQVRQQYRKDLDALRADLTAALGQHQQQLDSLRALHTQRERQAATFDAAGLPLIGVGIAMTGLPNQAVQHWWISGLLFAITALVLIATINRLRGAAPARL